MDGGFRSMCLSVCLSVCAQRTGPSDQWSGLDNIIKVTDDNLYFTRNATDSEFGKPDVTC